MRRLGQAWQPIVSAERIEAGRDFVARGQAALQDEHVEGALRQMMALYDLLVPPLDDWTQKRLEAENLLEDAAPLSAAVGLLGLWDEILDIDVERESIEELLIFHAAHANFEALLPPPSTRAQLEAALRSMPKPRSSWWRRLVRRAAGGLPDGGYITVQRANAIVFERPPPLPAATAQNFSSDDAQGIRLGAFCDGDRFTLRWPMALPGQLAVVHAVENSDVAELSLLLPQDSSEAVSRRHHEVVEVSGELVAVPGCSEHGLAVLWGPELLPPAWPGEALVRRRVPSEVRALLYRYTVAPSLSAASAS